jgi:hypothetical protein
MVIQLAHDPKFAGLNLAPGEIEKKMFSFFILASGCSTLLTQMTLNLKFKGSNLSMSKKCLQYQEQLM